MLRGRKDVVVVGVAAGDDDGALAYAVAEVARRGVGCIHVVHVVGPLASGGVPVPMVMEGDTLRLAGARAVGDAARRLEHVLRDTAITTELAHGPVVPGLVRASRHARMVVVQHQRRRGRHRRAPSLSVTNGVAAHAHVPVVVVPTDWQPATTSDHTVVAGLDAPATAPGVLRTALDEAVARRGSLRVVQVWRDSGLYDHRGNEGEAGRAYEELRRDLEREIALMLADEAGVPVEVVVEHARARVLIDASGTAEVLVVGRHHPSVPWGAHLGSTVRAVLRDSASPVLVVDPSPGPREES